MVSYGRAPLSTPYLLFLALLLICALAVALVPETVVRPEQLPAYRPRRVSLPPASRSTFYAAAIGAFAAFAINGLVLALVPTLLHQDLHESSSLLAGVTAFAVIAVGVIAQFAFSAMGTRGQLRIGLTAMVVGSVTLPVSVLTVHLWLFLLGGILAGVGVALLFRTSVATAAGLADGRTGARCWPPCSWPPTRDW